MYDDKPKRVFSQGRSFCLTTRVKASDMVYFDGYRRIYGKICRRIWQDLKNGALESQMQSTYIKHTMKEFGVSKRTVNSAFRQMKGRRNALDELQKTEVNNLEDKIASLEVKISNQKSRVERLKNKVVTDCNKKALVGQYRNAKSRLYRLQSKLNHCRQRFDNYNRGLYDGNLCFGGKKLFDSQHRLSENGFKTHEGWYNAFVDRRDGQVYYLGSSDETCGNQMCQLYYDENSDLFTLKVRKELAYDNTGVNDKYLYIPLAFKYKKELILWMLERGLSLTYDILKKGRKWYVEVKFSIAFDVVADRRNGCVGIDFNNGFLAVSETDDSGNLVNTCQYELKYHGCGNKAKSEISETVSYIVRNAQLKGKALCIENLDFKKKKSKQVGRSGKQYNRMLHTLDTGRFKQMCEDYCSMYGVPLYKVNPAYTSKIGKKKYSDTRKLSVHNAAAYVIARRGQGYKDKNIA